MSDYVAIVEVEDRDEQLNAAEIKTALMTIHALKIFEGIRLNIEVKAVETT